MWNESIKLRLEQRARRLVCEYQILEKFKGFLGADGSEHLCSNRVFDSLQKRTNRESGSGNWKGLYTWPFAGVRSKEQVLQDV